MTLGRDTSFTWLGHAGVEIVTPGGSTVLVDPWFGNPNSPRTQEQQPACDVLLVTHGHFDHFDADTLALARRCTDHALHPRASLYLGGELGEAAEVIGMNQGGTVETHGLRITMVPAVHSAGDSNMGGEAVQYFGQPVGFVIELENGFRVYDAGDTMVFGDMALIRDLFRPDLAIIPIGGHFTMDPVAASLAVELLGVHDVLPVHWGTFPILAGTPAALQQAIEVRGGHARVHAWAPGDSVA
jgi:L-ascorbate metabolism protein UlaG (beta-lactamase superfamily)